MTYIPAVRGGAGDITNPNLNARPQDNLYLAVNSEWLEKVKIPSDRSRTSSFDKIDENVEKHLMNDFANFADGKKAIPEGKEFANAVELYKIARNFDKRNADGAAPIQEDLKLLEGLRDFDDFMLKAADLAKAGFPLPIDFGVDVDMKNTKVHVLQNAGPSVFLPDTSTYKNAKASEKLLSVLEKQSVNLLKMAGVANAETYVKNALAYDQKISKVVKSSEEWADYPATYNPYKMSDFESKFTEFKVAEFLKELLGELPERIIVQEPRYLDHVNELINADNFDEIKGWMLVKFINSVASYLSQDFREAAFPFHQALTGQPELQSQEKQAYHVANGTFSEVVGIYYGKTYFGNDAKKDVLDMIDKMIAVYKRRLQDNTWLSEATKKQAIIKLEAMVLKVGYPDKIEEIYKKFKITPEAEGGTLYSNERATGIEAIKYNLAKLNKEVDRTIWNMPGNLVNACYDPSRNDLTFPAAILQAPFYDLKQSRSDNYGGIGVVIAHEISHAFDNNGAKFDEFGNMKNWWTEKDFAEFKKRTQAEIELFDGIQYGPVKLNGKQIVSENIADQGGLTAAVNALAGEGNGDFKALFENFARVWATKQLPAAIKTQVAVDVHAPGPLRANIQSQCQEKFYEAFDVKPSDGMYLDPDKRVSIW